MLPFKMLKFFESNKIQSLLNGSNNWYSKKDFSKIIKNEISKSYRTDKPLSLITVDFSSFSKTMTTIPDHKLFSFLREIVSIISLNSRDCDIKSIQSLSKIVILEVNTPVTSAKIYIEKISRLLNEHFRNLNDSKYLELIHHIAFSAFPLNYLAGNEEIKAKSDLIQTKDTSSSSDITENTRILIKKTSEFQLRWDIRVSPEGTISLPTPYIVNEFYHSFLDFFSITLKRATDIIGSLFGLVLFFPVTIIIIIAIKFSSSGPVLFKQQRIGFAGKSFICYKFRTMQTNCDDKIHQDYVKKLIEGKMDEINNGTQSKPVYKITNDPRITKIGLILRKTSMDELPQFINVFKGEMSLVGPRPPIPYEVESYKSWHLRRIMEIKPGITGLWQVCGRSQTSFDEMVRYDLQYVRNRSFLLDIKILLKTFSAVLNSHGAI